MDGCIAPIMAIRELGGSILDSGFAIIPGENDPICHGDDQKGVF